MGLLDGKVAVVTGAGRGLGRAHALGLAGAGAAVLVNDVDGTSAAGVAAEIEHRGGRALADASDLAHFSEAGAVVGRAVAELGRVDIVVNNAGVSRPAPIEHLTEAELGLHLAVHLGATVATTAAAFHAMRATGGGRVINTVSGHGLEPRAPESSAYAAAKAAVFGFTRAAAIEAARIGVTVNAVAPLAFTRMSAGYLSQVPEAEERFDPAHVAAVVVFLASELARHVNGRVLRVEGPRVSEYRVGTSPAIEAAVWTPEALAERIGEVLGA